MSESAAQPSATLGDLVIEPAPALTSTPPASHVGITVATLAEHVRAANLEFLDRVNDGLSLPISVLIQQRDAALAELAAMQQRVEAELQRSAVEHETFVSYLMEEQLAAMRGLRQQLKNAQEDLTRTKALAPRPVALASAPEGGEDGESQGLASALAQIETLRTELEAAFAEVDEARSAAAVLQDERDAAIREADDVRLELQAEIAAARDETFEVQTRLDAALRSLDDAHDEGRDEALRLNEELDEVKRALDERNAEVLRLRRRLGEGTANAPHSLPPPSTASTELEATRREVKWLRQQLIDAKRQASKVAAEAPKRAYRGVQRSLAGESRSELSRLTAANGDPSNGASVSPNASKDADEGALETAKLPVGRLKRG